MGRGLYRGVYSSLFDDPDYQKLSAHARLAFLTLRLTSQAGAAAIFVYYASVVAQQSGLTRRALEKAIVELASANPPWLYRQEPIVWLRNALRNDPSMTIDSPKHRKAVEKSVSALPKLDIVAKFCDYYHLPKPFGSLSNPIHIPIDRQPLPIPIPRQIQSPKTETETEPSERLPEGSVAAPEIAEQEQAKAERVAVIRKLVGGTP
mgnify:CR=1 FL=1